MSIKELLAAIPKIDTWVFDLDDTIYPRSSGLHEQMLSRVLTYIQDITGENTEISGRIHQNYYHTYGTSMVGLMRHHGVSPLEFLQFVHDIDLSLLAREKLFAQMLEALPGRRIIFTNGSKAHAFRILDHLGIADCFEAICDIEACNFIGKPDPMAYTTLLSRHAIDPSRAVMFDDRLVNLEVSREIGMRTVLVCEEEVDQIYPSDHIIIKNIKDFLYECYHERLIL